MTAAAAIDVAPEADCGLRERKKRETRKSIHRSALELAFEAGLEALTVDAIAERAGVSARTFFNYYPAKDDAILGADGTDPEPLLTLIASRPAGEAPRETVLAVAHYRVAALVADPQLWAMRRELTLREPGLGLRFLGIYARADRALVEAILERQRAERALTPDEALGIAVEAYAALGAFRAAIRLHIDGAYGDLPLAEVLDRAFARL